MASAHDSYAKEYDDQIKLQACYIAEVLFGLSYEYIKKGDSILDVGIGTGISSKLFFSAGLQVSGIDGSAEMINICKKKGITEELIEHDLLATPWPYRVERFDHVVCCGVFHFIGDLEKIFEEISRVHKMGGILAFTVMNDKVDQQNQGKYEQRMEGDFTVFCHKANYINNLIQINHYRTEKDIICQVGENQFRGIVAHKVNG